MTVTSNVKAGGVHTDHGRAVKGLRVKSKFKAGTTAALLVLSLAQAVTTSAQHGREWHEQQARREREIQACSRPAEDAYKKAVDESRHAKRLAEQKADAVYREAMRNAKTEAARTAARRAKREAMLKARDAARSAVMAARRVMQLAVQSCRNPKPPETAKKSPEDNNARGCGSDNPAAGTLGHGPRGHNSVRMDLRVVDATGKPVRGVNTKLWSERQGNGLFCETAHTTGDCGNVLMDPIHVTKTLQLELKAKGFQPQVIQVDPAQLDRPFQVVMQTK
ncbi:MAG TPA: hypothetical protein VF659_01790 [Pyrinomonadaceae bacterium]|jgi:hypothetical protein